MIRKLKTIFQKRDEDGQGLVEYGLILGLIAIICVGALSATGGSVNALLQAVADSLSTVGS